MTETVAVPRPRWAEFEIYDLGVEVLFDGYPRGTSDFQAFVGWFQPPENYECPYAPRDKELREAGTLLVVVADEQWKRGTKAWMPATYTMPSTGPISLFTATTHTMNTLFDDPEFSQVVLRYRKHGPTSEKLERLKAKHVAILAALGAEEILMPGQGWYSAAKSGGGAYVYGPYLDTLIGTPVPPRGLSLAGYALGELWLRRTLAIEERDALLLQVERLSCTIDRLTKATLDFSEIICGTVPNATT